MWDDTAAIRALAGRLRERAEEVRDLAARLSASAREVAWQGIAAEALRHHVEARVLALLRTATLHEDAAEALEQHARDVGLAIDLALGLVRGPLGPTGPLSPLHTLRAVEELL